MIFDIFIKIIIINKSKKEHKPSEYIRQPLLYGKFHNRNCLNDGNARLN